MKVIKNLKLLFLILFLIFCNKTFSDVGQCEAESGYIEKKNLIRLVDRDCSEHQGDGLCSFLVDAPYIYEGRDFWGFSFRRVVDGRVQTFLNMQHTKAQGAMSVGFEVAKDSLSAVEITAVYQNIDGCTLQSTLKLSETSSSP